MIFVSAGFTFVSSSLFLTEICEFVKLFSAIAFMSVFVKIRGNRFWLCWDLGCAELQCSFLVCSHLLSDSESCIPQFINSELCILAGILSIHADMGSDRGYRFARTIR